MNTNIKAKIKGMAMFMHILYEEKSKEAGWDTQKKCKVEFDDLPEKNKQTKITDYFYYQN